MKIIIIGAGKVGNTLASTLSQEEHDISIIDNSTTALSKIEDTLDVMVIKGSGVSTSTLLEAGASTVDLIIAVTGSDEVNMLCCLTAKKLGAKRTIARIRDPKYAREMSLIKEDLGLDMVINPEEAAAEEIAGILTFPGAKRLESFAKGRVRMVELKVQSSMRVCGVKIKDLHKKLATSVLIGIIIRNEQIIIPHGEFIIKEDDSIYIIGKSTEVYKFCVMNQEQSRKVKNVMIVGGGKISFYLAKLLSNMFMNVKIIESDPTMCLELSETFPHLLILNGDGTDETLLESENIENIDSFIALTGHDEENIMASLIAKQHEVPRVISKISRTNYETIIKKMGIDNIICPKLIITHQILSYIRGNSVESLYRVVDGQAEIIEFVAEADDLLINIPLHKLKLPQNVLITTIVRKDAVVIPNGNDSIKIGDRVIVITSCKNITCLKDFVGGYTGGFHSELKNSFKKLGHIVNM